MNLLKKLFQKKVLEGENCSVVIVAAGTASRMEGIDKIIYPLDGTAAIIHCIRPFLASDMVEEIIIVTREDMIVPIGDLCKTYGCTKVKKVISGGETRQISVALGLAEVGETCGFVAIHDGARPFVTVEVIENALKQAKKTGAAAPGIPVKDTIKSCGGDVVEETLDREKLFAIQTPQIFEKGLITLATAKSIEENWTVTDDCSVVEKLKIPVVITSGSEENIKLTTPMDLVLGEAILARRLSL